MAKLSELLTMTSETNSGCIAKICRDVKIDEGNRQFSKLSSQNKYILLTASEKIITILF